MNYDINTTSNVGIAFAWREHIYYNYKPTTIIGRGLKIIAYHLFSIFSKDSVKYKFDESV